MDFFTNDWNERDGGKDGEAGHDHDFHDNWEDKAREERAEGGHEDLGRGGRDESFVRELISQRKKSSTRQREREITELRP